MWIGLEVRLESRCLHSQPISTPAANQPVRWAKQRMDCGGVMPLANVLTITVGVCSMKLACFQDNWIQRKKPRLLEKRQIHCHFHPFEELHILMGKVPEVIKPDSSTEP